MKKKHDLKKLLLPVCVAAAPFCAPAAFASNDAMLDLLDVLRQEGVISNEAYTVLKNSAKADAEQTEAKINEVTEEVKAAAMEADESLAWAKKFKLKGDLRLRHQHSEQDLKDAEDPNDRNRFRLRYRLGVEGEVTDTVVVGAGIASGSDDPRSTNETFDDQFSTKAINLDYAYAEWKPNDMVSVVGGKFKRKEYLWAPTDLLWDGDINPEGASVHLQSDVAEGLTAWGNVGHWILDEFSKDSNDPNLTYLQGGAKFKSGNLFGNAAATYYAFSHLKGEMFLNDHVDDASDITNTLDASNRYMYDYDSFGLSAEVGVNDVLMPGKMIAVFGDYIKNTDSDADEDTGYAIGFKFGDPKVKNFGQWQFKYIYADLEEDAFVDFTPDSDRLGGGTGLESHEFVFEFGLAKNLTLGFDYYDTDNEQAGNSGDSEKILQSDLLFKF